MKIKVHESRELELIEKQGTQNENDVELLELEVPEKYENWNKKIVFVPTDNDPVWDLFVDNKYSFRNNITHYDKIDFYIWLTHEDKDFRSMTRTLFLNENVDASNEITPEEQGAVNTILEELDTALEETNQLKEEVNNLDVDADGEILTITKKDGSTKEVNIKGEKGDTGDTGATPNIQIGNVTSGNQPEVSRRGTDENPIFDFVLEKGEKGDKGDPGEVSQAQLDEVKNNVEQNSYNIDLINSNLVALDKNYEMGSITADGEEQEKLDGTRWRTPANEAYSVSNIEYIDIPSGYYIWVFYYINGAFSSRKGPYTNQQYVPLKPSSVPDIRLVVAKGSGYTGVLTLDEVKSKIKVVTKSDLENRVEDLEYATNDEFEDKIIEGEQFELSDSSNNKVKISLKGNTSQETTEGYQLFDKDNATVKSMNASISVGNTSTYTSASNQKHVFIQCKPNTTYKVQKDVTDVSVLGIYETEQEPAVGVSYKTLYFSSNSSGKATITTGDNTNYLDLRLNTNAITSAILQKILNSILIYEGSETKPYEKYTGKQPAPNSEYPQTVQVVKGSNTILITDNNEESQNYPITLPTGMEMCKIGDYADEIVWQNDKWYKNKLINKLILNGTENWNLSNGIFYLSSGFDTNLFVEENKVFCNKYLGVPAVYNASYITVNNTCGVTKNANLKRIYIKDDSCSTVDEFKASLSNIPATMYYILQNIVLEEITDTTLINQLNNIKEAYTYQEETNISQTNEDLPFVLSVDYKLSNLTRIKKMEENCSTLIPEYWENYLNSKYETLNNLDATVGNSGDSFVFVTDVHINNNNMKSPSIIENILKNTSTNQVVCGGDILTSYSTQEEAINNLVRWRNKFTNVTNMMNVFGNHDRNYEGNSQNPDAYLTMKQFFGICLKKYENVIKDATLYGNQHPCYYDNNSQKIRYIYLYTGNESLADIQLTRMQELITELSSDWSVIIFAHIFFNPSTTDVVAINPKGTRIMQFIDEIYDTCDATIIGVITGHMHRDYNITSEKGYPIIATTCDASGSHASTYDINFPIRTQGTTTEQAFDVFHIDKDNRKIYATRIGAGIDREFSY